VAALAELARDARHRFGYDAVEEKDRRKPPSANTRSEDDLLTPGKRKKLTGATRDIHRNFSIAGWAIRKHLDYVSTFSFQSRTGIKALDDEIERLFAWWSRPRNCDVAGRHSLGRLVRLAEARRTVDGDVFLLKLSDGRLQAIEGDRICTPTRGLPAGVKAKEFTHGVQTDKAGRPRAYCICKRSPLGGFAFERIVRAAFMEHHGFFDRFDQLRGISPLAPAVNTLRDCYEGYDYALAKMKVAQLFALAFYRQQADFEGETYERQTVISGSEDAAEGSLEAADQQRYKVDFGRGPIKLELDDGDRAEFLESKSPSTEFQAFSQVMIATALKALDIPYSFYDEAHTNYSGARQALLQYEQSADVKRQDVRDLLNRLTAWRLGHFIADGVLELPAGMALRDLRWEWIARGIPWIDPLKEVNADIAAVGAGLSSRGRVLKRQGLDFAEVARELAAENELLAELGLPTNVSPANAEIVEIAQ